MKIKTVLFLLAILTLHHTQCRATAHFFIKEEKGHPYDPQTQLAKKQYTWTINGVVIRYNTGQYNVPVKGENIFDTIVFQNIAPVGNILRNGKHPLDTSRTIILCKLRENHNYKLAQIYPGDFEIYSLDTFSSRISIKFTVQNKSDKDTLFYSAGRPQKMVFSDTTFLLTDDNKKMSQSFTAHIEFTKTPGIPVFDGPGTPNENLFEVSFLFLHEENLSLMYNYATDTLTLQLE